MRFTKNALESTGLRGLSEMRSLRQLSLATLLNELTATDYEEIARLPALDELRINGDVVEWAGPALPRISSLRLNRFLGTEDLSGVPALFPGLRRVTIVLAPEAAEVPEHILDLFPCAPALTKMGSVI